jgi:hypothetical protein
MSSETVRVIRGILRGV